MAVIACTPQPAVPPLAYVRAGKQHVLDPATCRDRVVPGSLPAAPLPAHVLVTKRWQWIVVGGRKIVAVTQQYRTIGPGDTPGPIELLGASGDRKWIFFTTDPGGSASIAADGLVLRVVSARGGRVHELGPLLAYPDYLAWCGGRLVWSGGGDRLAVHNKRLLAASPPDWRPRPLVPDRGRAWGSLTCTPDDRAVVVQSQRENQDSNFFHTHWALWRIGLDGSERRLTSPPAGDADESPRYAGSTLLFVRSRQGHGVLRTQAGTLAPLGYDIGYYGHHAWPYAVRR